MELDSNVVNNVITLAEQRYFAGNVFYSKYYPNGVMPPFPEHTDSVEYAAYQTAQNSLRNYLISLDAELVHELKVLMYLGRDNQYYGEPDGMRRFQLLYEDFRAGGWDSKEIEVTVLMEKTPLPQYLRNGMAIIGQ